MTAPVRHPAISGLITILTRKRSRACPIMFVFGPTVSDLVPGLQCAVQCSVVGISQEGNRGKVQPKEWKERSFARLFGNQFSYRISSSGQFVNLVAAIARVNRLPPTPSSHLPTSHFIVSSMLCRTHGAVPGISNANSDFASSSCCLVLFYLSKWHQTPTVARRRRPAPSTVRHRRSYRRRPANPVPNRPRRPQSHSQPQNRLSFAAPSFCSSHSPYF